MSVPGGAEQPAHIRAVSDERWNDLKRHARAEIAERARRARPTEQENDEA